MRWQQKLAEAGETKRSSPWRNQTFFPVAKRMSMDHGAMAALVTVARFNEPPAGGRQTRPDRRAGLDVYPQCLVFVSFNHGVVTPKSPRGPVATSFVAPPDPRDIFVGVRKRASRPPTCTTRGPKKCTTSNNPRADATAIDPGSGSPWPRATESPNSPN